MKNKHPAAAPASRQADEQARSRHDIARKHSSMGSNPWIDPAQLRRCVWSPPVFRRYDAHGCAARLLECDVSSPHFYFEVGEHQGMTRQAIEAYLGPERSRNLTALPYGYECELTIQVVPDIVRELAAQSIAVYQVVRYAKTKNVWT